MGEGKRKVGEEGDWRVRLEEEDGGRDDFLDGGGTGAGADDGVEVGVEVGMEVGAEESGGGGESSL